MSTTFSAWRKGIKSSIWPFPGEAKSLVDVHNKYVVEGMIELQKWVPCLSQNHTSLYPACSSYVNCGLTVVEAPVGIVKRVYTISPVDGFCDKVFISSRSHKEVLSWQKSLLLRFTQPANLNMPALQQGFRFAEASTDSVNGRARFGIWSINRGRFHLAPWMQSNEALVIEWDGAKTIWGDADLLDESLWSPDVTSAVRLYVQIAHERDFGCDTQRMLSLKMDYDRKLGDLMYWCMKRTENQENTDAEELNTRGPTQEELADDEPETEDDESVIAYVADFGNGTGTADVAAMVNGWGPDYVVSGGDVWYGSSTAKGDLDAAVGPYYGDYIYPYIGSLADGADRTNNFFTAVGDHDRDPVGRLQVFQNYFNLKKPYYDFIRGHVHWFMVDQGFDDSDVLKQPDGNTATSVQGESFRLRMALSTARWKIVVIGAPPYSSNKPYAALQWPFKVWGADLVLSGDSHLYERLLAPEGYPLIVAGWSGRTLHVAAAPNAYSQVQYDADFGALKLTVSCDEFKVEAINRVGTLIDTLTLTKP